MRPSLYLYSNRNIAGCGLAIAAVSCYFAGIINEFWYAIVAGSYGIGALITRDSPEMQTRLTAEADLAQISDELRRYAAEAETKLPPDIATLVESITTSLLAILPTLKDQNVTQALFDVKQTATSYLPNTVNAYLALPAAYRNTVPVQAGKTARQIVVEQLGLLSQKMNEMAVDAAKDNAQNLLANGRFLQDKFVGSALSTA
jgi:hypothetical protein